MVIGVTGTDGKTTTTNLIYHILKEAGKNVSVISTVSAVIGDVSYDTGFHLTTPSALSMQKYIKMARDAGSNYLVLEVSSHALHQNRAYGIKFAIGVLTNISHEHMDYHKTYEEYVKAKAILFKNADIAILNYDDKKSYEEILKYIPHKNINRYSLFSKNTEFNSISFPFKTELLGDFNKQNCLAAISVAKTIGLDDEIIRKALASFKAPEGRQELLYDKDFKVIVDFAHTPNAFEKILPAVKEVTSGRLIHVFGSAGRRDVSKRPLMGSAASRFDDIIILTSEDPRDENPEDINQGIKKGIEGFESGILERIEEGKKYIFEIADRKKAIEFAVGIAQNGDTVILTGKGHEKSINYGRGEEDWDEIREAKQAIELRNK